MRRLRTRLTAVIAVAGLSVTALVASGSTAQAVTQQPYPALTYNRVLGTHPFAGTPLGTNASDIEGLAYVPADNTLFIADDNADSLWMTNPLNGGLNSPVFRLRGGDSRLNSKNVDFTTATDVVSGKTCGQLIDPALTGPDAVNAAANSCLSRTDDFESVVFDGTNLYLTSGMAQTLCVPNPASVPPVTCPQPGKTDPGTPANPTIWKLEPSGNTFTPTHFQQLPDGTDPTAAGWLPGTGLIFGKGSSLQTYDFDTNTLGSTFSIGLSNIVGVTFDGPTVGGANTAYVTTAKVDTSLGRTTATSDSTIHRFDITGAGAGNRGTWTVNTAWTFPLKNIGAPGAALTADDSGMIDARDTLIIGDQFYVSDGYDGRPTGNHPIYVYDLVNSPPVAPSAAGYVVDGWGGLHGLTGTSGPAPATSGGPYWPGFDIARGVAVLPDGSGGFVLDGWGGLHAFGIGGQKPPTANGGPYWPNWDIARGVAINHDGKGGFVVDAWGGLHPFGINGNSKTSVPSGGPYWKGWDIVRGVALTTTTNDAGYILDGWGALHTFGGAPAASGGPYWKGWDISRGATTWGGGGYIVDGLGGLHPFATTGTAPGIPAGGPYWPNSNIARGVAAIQ